MNVELTHDCIESYGSNLRQLNLTSESSTGTLRLRSVSLTLFLTWLGEDDLVEHIPAISRKNTKTSRASSYSDEEQVFVVRD